MNAPSLASPLSTKSPIYIIDDHPMIVQGIALLINSEADLAVVGSSANWHVALKEIERLKPALVILDVALGNANGVDVLKSLKVQTPKQRVLMLSMHDENLYAVRAMKAGAYGYLMKAAAADQVIVAVRQILKGEVYLSQVMTKRMLGQFAGQTFDRCASPLGGLSDRQLQVYEMVGSGLTTRQIATRLYLSVKTIESHKARLKKEFGFGTAAELTQHAIEGTA
jgi:DNA-binding NarL/FixJ family response regulator